MERLFILLSVCDIMSLRRVSRDTRSAVDATLRQLVHYVSMTIRQTPAFEWPQDVFHSPMCCCDTKFRDQLVIRLHLSYPYFAKPTSLVSQDPDVRRRTLVALDRLTQAVAFVASSGCNLTSLHLTTDLRDSVIRGMEGQMERLEAACERLVQQQSRSLVCLQSSEQMRWGCAHPSSVWRT